MRPARHALRTAQEFGLLVRLSWQTITGRAFAAARRDACFSARWHVGCCLRLRRTLETLGAVGTIRPLWAISPFGAVRPLWPVQPLWAIAIHARFAAVGTITPVLAIKTFGAVVSVRTIIAVELALGAITAIVTVAEATAITLIATIAITALMLVAVFVLALRPIFVAAFPTTPFRDARLLAAKLAGRHRGIRLAVEAFVAILGAVAFAVLRREVAVIAGIGAALAHLLFTVGHDDAVIVLGVLEIILRQNRIAGRLGVPRQRHVFLGDVGGRAAQFHIGTVAFETPRQRVLAFALLIIVLVIVAAAASAVLLSLPHGLQSQPISLVIGYVFSLVRAAARRVPDGLFA